MKWQSLRDQRQEAALAFYTHKWEQPTADRSFVHIHPVTLWWMNKLWAKYFNRPVK